jgi:phosphatidate cytidylyltransferase
MSGTVGGGTRVRAGTGLVMAVLVLTVLWVPALYWVVDALVALLVAQGLREYCAMARAAGINVMPRATILTGVGLVLFNGLALFLWWRGMGGMPVVSGLSGALFVLVCARLATGRHDLRGMAADFFGVAYVAGLACYMLLMHHNSDMGPGLVTFLLVAVAWSDTGAYFIGRAFGRHKMAPVTSPKKSWEGAAGGVVFAMLAVLVLWLLVRHFGWQRHYPPAVPWVWALLAAGLSVVSQLGDLAESMIKREAGVKDASQIFPGHGGVLDRCDGLLFAAPALYYMYAGGVALSWILTG